MNDLVPQDRVPEYPSEEPVWEGQAQVVLPSDIFGMWMGKIKGFLAKAENGEDFTSVVVLAGYDKRRKPKFRVTWKARTKEGLQYLNSMAMSFRALPQDHLRLGEEDEGA